MVPDERTVDVDGRQRRYLLLTPPQVHAGTPLVLVLHGSTQTPAIFRRATGDVFDTLAGRYGAVVAFLEGHRRGWNDERRDGRQPAHRDGVDDVGFVETVSAALATELGLAENRPFLIGYSNGGQLVMRLLQRTPQQVRAAVVIAATLPVPTEDDPAGVVPGSVPLVLVHGTADRVVPYRGGQAKLLGVLPRGRGISAPATARHFATRNDLDLVPTRTELPAAGRTHVVREEFSAPGRDPVVQFTVVGGGHTVPGPTAWTRVMGRTNADVNTADIAAEFFGFTTAVTV
jgi:polyhydroxybutyrate depolymerase